MSFLHWLNSCLETSKTQIKDLILPLNEKYQLLNTFLLTFSFDGVVSNAFEPKLCEDSSLGTFLLHPEVFRSNDNKLMLAVGPSPLGSPPDLSKLLKLPTPGIFSKADKMSFGSGLLSWLFEGVGFLRVDLGVGTGFRLVDPPMAPLDIKDNGVSFAPAIAPELELTSLDMMLAFCQSSTNCFCYTPDFLLCIFLGVGCCSGSQVSSCYPPFCGFEEKGGTGSASSKGGVVAVLA